MTLQENTIENLKYLKAVLIPNCLGSEDFRVTELHVHVEPHADLLKEKKLIKGDELTRMDNCPPAGRTQKHHNFITELNKKKRY